MCDGLGDRWNRENRLRWRAFLLATLWECRDAWLRDRRRGALLEPGYE